MTTIINDTIRPGDRFKLASGGTITIKVITEDGKRAIVIDSRGKRHSYGVQALRRCYMTKE